MSIKKTVKKATKARGGFSFTVKVAPKKVTPSVHISRTSDGKFVIDGTIQGRLVNRHPEVKLRKASVKPSHFSESDISEIVKSMKVA